ncbi:MAG: PAS domain-containing protein, partial [Clostridiales Family XIII bacterium]|nr:PAS domain-containing protein [Clostridiales Family XIII bacterium]
MSDAQDLHLYKNIITNSPNGIIVTDMTFRVLYLNQTVSELWKLDRKGAQGRDLHELVPELQDINKLDNRVYHINI